jgi:predicted dehydrogenase
LLDLGVHALDMALWLMDFPRATRVTGVARAVHAAGDRIRGRWGDWDRSRFDVEDFAAGFVHFINGATLSIESAWLGHHFEEGLGCELVGERASLRWPDGDVISQGTETATRRLAEPEPPFDASHADPHRAALEAFRDSVTQKLPSPVSWKEAVASVEIIEALYASARAGREIVLG